MSRLSTKQRRARLRGKVATPREWHVTETAWDFGPGADLRHYWRRLPNPDPEVCAYADLPQWEYGRTVGGPTSLRVGPDPLSASETRDNIGRVPSWLANFTPTWPRPRLEAR